MRVVHLNTVLGDAIGKRRHRRRDFFVQAKRACLGHATHCAGAGSSSPSDSILPLPRPARGDAPGNRVARGADIHLFLSAAAGVQSCDRLDKRSGFVDSDSSFETRSIKARPMTQAHSWASPPTGHVRLRVTGRMAFHSRRQFADNLRALDQRFQLLTAYRPRRLAEPAIGREPQFIRTHRFKHRAKNTVVIMSGVSTERPLTSITPALKIFSPPYCVHNSDSHIQRFANSRCSTSAA